MMPVKHAILALLAARDLTGYELKVRFERVLGDFWQLNSGQVYSTLERLRRSGLVQRRVEPGAASATPPAGSAGDRLRYTILPRGRRELERWLASAPPRLRPMRDPLYVKLVFSPPERVSALLVAFAAEARRYREAVETLTALVAREPLSHGGRARWLVAEAARLGYEAQLRWIESVRRVLAAPAPPLPASDGRPLQPPPRRSEHALRGAAPPR
jgi:DNA-binding PadR family transcriptional regulator